MPEVRYTIKSKADVKAIKETERSLKDLGAESEKATRKLKEQTRATKESGKSLKDAATSGGTFARSIGKQVFGSLVSFAVVTKAVNSLRTILSPALSGVTTDAKSAGEALGRFISADGALDGAGKPFLAIADALNSFSDAMERVDINLEKTLPKLADPRLAKFATQEAGVFRAESAAFAAADARTLSEFDAETAQRLARPGITKEQAAAITRSRADERARIQEGFSQRDMQRLREFQSSMPSLEEMVPAIQELNVTMRELNEATKELEERQKDAIKAEQNVLQGGSGTPGLGVGITGATITIPSTAAERKSAADMARAQAEQALQRRNALFNRVQQLRARTMGMSSFQELGQFGDALNASSAALGSEVAGGISSREGEAQAGASSASRSAALLQAQGRQDQLTAALAESNKIKAEQAALIRQGISLDSQAYRAMSDRIRNLETIVKEQRNSGL